MRTPTFTLSVMAALALTGCASTGMKVDPQAAASLKIGEHTCADVTARLGTPTMDTASTATGQRTLTYTYAEAEVRAASFVPVVGLFAGGVDSKATSYAFVCDRNDKLVDTATSTATQGTNTGILHRTTQ